MSPARRTETRTAVRTKWMRIIWGARWVRASLAGAVLVWGVPPETALGDGASSGAAVEPEKRGSSEG